MGDLKPKKKESLIEELIKLPMYSPPTKGVTYSFAHYYGPPPRISLPDIAARRFNILDRRPIGTPMTRVEQGIGKLMHYYGMRISLPYEDPYYFPKRAVVLSFHEPEEPAEVLLFWDEDSATEIYEEWRKGLSGIHGPWALTLYRIGEEGYPLPQAEDVDVVLNMKNEVVDVRWPPSLIMSHGHGLVGLEGFKPWESMIKPPAFDTANPCREISLTGESSPPSYTSIARKLLMVDELPAGALVSYERETKKPEK